MKKVAELKHHSLTDWDFDPLPGWHIDTADYVSPPSSLSAYTAFETGFRWVYLKQAIVADLPDGRVVTWIKFRDLGVGFLDFQFRVQAIPEGGGVPDDYYYCRIEENKIIIGRHGFGEAVETWEFTPPDPPSLDEWEHWRLSFWQFSAGEEAQTLRIVLEKEVDEEWIEQAAVEDDKNGGADGGANRVGLRLQRVIMEKRTNIDDTEVWERVD
jgi:hypothetical protein